MPSEEQPVLSREYFRGFDGLRGVAVAMVLFGHIIQQDPHLPKALPSFVAIPLGSAVGSGVALFLSSAVF